MTQEKLPWAEEVLVSKADLDERRARVAELEQQVSGPERPSTRITLDAPHKHPSAAHMDIQLNSRAMSAAGASLGVCVKVLAGIFGGISGDCLADAQTSCMNSTSRWRS